MSFRSLGPLLLGPIALSALFLAPPLLARAGVTEHDTRMPCPSGLSPDTLHISWSLGTGEQGARTMRARATTSLYHVVCGLTLVRYSRPFVTACPAAMPENTGT